MLHTQKCFSFEVCFFKKSIWANFCKKLVGRKIPNISIYIYAPPGLHPTRRKSQCCTRQWLDNVDAQISSHTTLGNLPRKIDGASPQNICNCCYCRHLFLSSKLHIYYIESRSIDPAWETSHDWPPPPPLPPSWSPSELGPSAAAAARGMSAARESSLRNFVTLTTRLSYVHRSSPSLASCI